MTMGKLMRKRTIVGGMDDSPSGSLYASQMRSYTDALSYE